MSDSNNNQILLQPKLTNVFVRNVYKYYRKHGYFNIVFQHFSEIILIHFFIFFTSFLFLCVDYQKLFDSSTSSNLSEYIDFSKFGTNNAFIILYWMLSVIVIFYKFMVLFVDSYKYYDIYKFYKRDLHLETQDLKIIKWSLVVERLKEYYKEDYDFLDEYYLANMILLRENYFIALVNNNVFDLMFNRTKWVDSGFYFNNILIWNIMYCLNYCYTNEFNLKIQLSNQDNIYYFSRIIQQKFKILAVINLLILPFLLIFIGFYYVFKYGAEFYKYPMYIVKRHWTPLAKWKYRDYNELDHIFEERLLLSGTILNDYFEQFSYQILNITVKTCMFIVSSFLIIILFFSLINETILLNVLVLEKSLLWYFGIFGTILAVCKSLINEKEIVYPIKIINKLHTYIKELPYGYQDVLKQNETCSVLSEHYKYRFLIILSDLCGVILNPFLLYFILPRQSEDIIKFFYNNTIYLKDVGYVCSHSIFDNNNDEIITSNNRYHTVLTNSKVENSILNFKNQHPDWQPSKPLFSSSVLETFP